MVPHGPRYIGSVALLLGTGLASFAFASHGEAASAQKGSAAPVKKVLIKESNNRYAYTPAKITVAKGTTVSWANKTDVEHNVTAKGSVKINKDIEDGKTARFTFTKSGTFHYHCEYHPYMKGTIVVK